MPADRALALAGQGAVGRAPSLSASVSMARSHQRLDGKHKAMQLQDDAKAVAYYEANRGSKSLDKLLEALPFLTADMVSPVPSGQLQCFTIKSHGIQNAVMGCAWACASKRGNVGTGLEEGWAEDHQTVMHSACPAVEADEPLSSACRDAGICICSGAGKQLHRFRNALLKDMKSAFKNTSARALLAEGFIVAHIVNMGAAASQEPLIADAGAGGQALEDLWLHIGLQYFRPYRPTYHKMMPVENPEPESCPTWTYLKASQPASVSYLLLASWFANAVVRFVAADMLTIRF
jgi:hypothetical protein